jgi:hypothetical protein
MLRIKRKSAITFLGIGLAAMAKAQQPRIEWSPRLGYATTNIVFKEAILPQLFVFDILLSPGKTFVGEGPEVGLSASMGSHWQHDVAYTSFRGKETKLVTGVNENLYELRGNRISFSTNYLFRKPEKWLRFTVGAGLQIMSARLQQFDKVSNTQGVFTTLIKNIKITEPQLLLRTGVQARVAKNLYLLFAVPLAISFNGRYTDGVGLSVRYQFARKAP